MLSGSLQVRDGFYNTFQHPTEGKKHSMNLSNKASCFMFLLIFFSCFYRKHMYFHLYMFIEGIYFSFLMDAKQPTFSVTSQ